MGAHSVGRSSRARKAWNALGRGMLLPILLVSPPLLVDRVWFFWLYATLIILSLSVKVAYGMGFREGAFRERVRCLEREDRETLRRILAESASRSSGQERLSLAG